jgi:membrane-associated protein
VELLRKFVDLFLHLDVHLGQVIQQYGGLTYGILFAIIFCETGLVVTPILPGDSLLFAAGSFAALGSLKVTIGKFLGNRIFSNPDSRIFKREYLERTRAFYAKHGAKTIVMARFVPIVRTFAPFVAGMGSMRFRTYIAYCVGGALLWVTVCTGAGYLFGNIPMVKKNFTVVVLAIIVISMLPGLIGYLRSRKAARAPEAV